MAILTIFFFITAILYASIGFGGGSTYLALMLIWDIPFYIFPIIALICNIIVVTSTNASYRYPQTTCQQIFSQNICLADVHVSKLEYVFHMFYSLFT